MTQAESMGAGQVAQGQTQGRGKGFLAGVSLGLRWLLAVVLVWAGLSKLVDPLNFYGAILEYQLGLPAIFLKATAMILPWMELFCGVLLVTATYRRAALFWITLLLLFFLVLTAQAHFRGQDISCGCFDLSVLGIEANSDLGRALESPGFAAAKNAVLLVCVFFIWIFNAGARGSSATNTDGENV